MRTPDFVDVPLRWADMDAYGHVNNVVFLRLLEQVRIEAMASWLPGRDMLANGVIVARQEIDYVGQLRYRPQPVRCDVWVSRLGGASFDVAYVVRDPDDVGEQTYAVAETTLVTFDFASDAPRRLGVDERASLQSRLGDAAPLRRRRGA